MSMSGCPGSQMLDLRNNENSNEISAGGGQEIAESSALRQSNRKIPIKYMVVSVQGGILKDEWVEV